MPDANTALMETIHARWGAAIDAACKTSAVPPAFLAALVANESGGSPDAKRFERAVLSSLWELLQGRTASFGSIGRNDVLAFLTAPDSRTPAVPPTGFVSQLARSLQQLDGLATSWGLTQVMGYEALAFSCTLADLHNPVSELRISLRLLAQFAERYQLDLAKDFQSLFDCWNTGRPHAPTADPDYIPNGLARMQIYQAILEEPPKAISA
jgi:hypothetical protein